MLTRIRVEISVHVLVLVVRICARAVGCFFLSFFFFVPRFLCEYAAV